MTNFFVIDTNTIISAHMFPASVPRQAYNHAIKSGVIVSSAATFTELKNTFFRKKFDKYISFEKRLEVISQFENTTLFIDIIFPVVKCRDPKDDKFLELAMAGKADCIVTGDNDLLVLHPFNNIPIVSSSQFLKLF